jgi:hypothetical protein
VAVAPGGVAAVGLSQPDRARFACRRTTRWSYRVAVVRPAWRSWRSGLGRMVRRSLCPASPAKWRPSRPPMAVDISSALPAAPASRRTPARHPRPSSGSTEVYSFHRGRRPIHASAAPSCSVSGRTLRSSPEALHRSCCPPAFLCLRQNDIFSWRGRSGHSG